MAFEKRTWLARIGQGLNKFIIGAKDGEGKQTLTNAPDSVTQIGDVISAENLNDLEDRIEAGFSSMKLTKMWENTSSGGFEGQTIELNTSEREFVIEFAIFNNRSNQTFFRHIKIAPDDSLIGYFCDVATYNSINIYSDNSKASTTYARPFGGYVNSNNKAQIEFGDNYAMTYAETVTIPPTDPSHIFAKVNSSLIPVAIYKVGNIYNS